MQPGELLVVECQLQQSPARDASLDPLVCGALPVEERLVQAQQTAVQVQSSSKQPTSHPDGHRVRPFVGPQFVYEVLDVETDCRLGDCQLRGDLLIAVVVSNEPERFQFPGREVFFAKMLGEAGNSANRPLNFIDVCFYYVCLQDECCGLTSIYACTTLASDTNSSYMIATGRAHLNRSQVLRLKG